MTTVYVIAITIWFHDFHPKLQTSVFSVKTILFENNFGENLGIWDFVKPCGGEQINRYFSNFSCMFLNPINFFQFELELF